MRSRGLLLTGSIVTLLVGATILTSSIHTIYSENAAADGYALLPAIVALESSTAISAQGIRAKINHGDLIGTLVIERLKKSIPIYQGTEAAQLKKGAGHYEKSVLPGVKDNSVIAGHRDSVFTQFGSLKRGDLLVVNTSYGKFTYSIRSFRIVDADDRTVIVPTKVATLTLSTCYPFHFIGSAPKRFIVSAVLINER
jgi:sortase A